MSRLPCYHLASRVGKIKYVFHLPPSTTNPATVSLQLFSFLFVIFYRFLFFCLVSVAVDFLAKAMFLFLFFFVPLCYPKILFFLLFSPDCFVLCSEAQKKYYFRYFVIASACSSCSHRHTHIHTQAHIDPI